MISQVTSHRGDQVGARTGDVSKVIHLPGDLVGVAAIEQQPQRFGLSGQILLVDELREQRLLHLCAFLRAHALRFQPCHGDFGFARPLSDLKQAAVGIADGALGGA
jgi:hypothetical protein